MSRRFRTFAIVRAISGVRYHVAVAALAALGVGSTAWAAPLTPIPRGDIAIGLQPIATGVSAPLYGISPPGDASRLFVLEQNGLVKVIQNGTVLSTPAL